MEHQSSASPLARHLRRLATVHPGHCQGLLRRRLLLRPRDQPARTHPHRCDRFILGRHADRFLDQPRRPLRRRVADACLRRARPLRRHADPSGADRIGREDAPTPRLPPITCPRPQHPWHPDPSSWIPAGLYNGMVAPFTPYAIKGFLWYQGETDSAPDRANLYAKLLPTLIADWRRQWRQGNLPFLFVQISSFDSPPRKLGPYSR